MDGVCSWRVSPFLYDVIVFLASVVVALCTGGDGPVLRGLRGVFRGRNYFLIALRDLLGV